MIGLLESAVMLGLVAASFVLLVQAFVPFDWKLRKPWGCVYCLSTHGAWITLLSYELGQPGFFDAFTGDWLQWLSVFTARVAAATPVSMLTVKLIKVLTAVEERSA